MDVRSLLPAPTFWLTHVLTMDNMPIAKDNGTNAQMAPLPCAAISVGPTCPTINWSTNCMIVNDVMVSTVGHATAHTSRRGDWCGLFSASAAMGSEEPTAPHLNQGRTTLSTPFIICQCCG